LAFQRPSECEIWYHVYPLGFLAAEAENPAPGASDGPVVHRLPELIGWLDYLAGLGVTALLVGPIWESESHGYDVIDPLRVDRRLGTEEDLVTLIEACHRRSIKVALDAVFNHVGRGHPHFRDVLAHRLQSAWRDWFEIDFGWAGPDGFAYANFEGHNRLVKLNHANSQVLNWAVDVAKFWIERGIDGFRLDAAYAISPSFLAAFADRSRAIRPDFFLVGEVIHGDYARFAQETHVESITQYELWKAIWSSLNDGNFFELAHALKRHAGYCQHFAPWTFVGNHDTTRIATQLNDPRHLGHALAVLFTVPGIPAIYAGDEQGAEGTKYHRAGGDAEVRRPPPHLPGELTGNRLDLWHLHRDLIAVRRARPWLATGALSVTRVTNRTMTFEVRANANRLVTVLNIEDKAVRCQMPADLIPVAGHASAELPSHSWGVWSTP
jgi:cyclomaltodextrinase / maltogenic alpha-amylase / neopullulanase